jgi:hypothetical protein
MARPSLADLTSAAAEADAPSFTERSKVALGGIDPLGLRQINFDLMDEVFPGLNNVARHIRPFVVVTWAWRRAKQLAERQGLRRVRIEELRDFVDRIEVIYAWSQFLLDPQADLPGSQVLSKIVRSDQPYRFGGAEWRKRCAERRDSTALTAPINYGPGLKTLSWVEVHDQSSDVLIPTPATTKTLDAFESQITDRLNHPAFSQFGSVEVTPDEVRAWAEGWAIDRVTAAEKHYMAEVLAGSRAPKERRSGIALMLEAARHSLGDEDILEGEAIDRVRRVMAGRPVNFVPSTQVQGAAAAWRRVQVRQLFRLALEALLYWIILEVGEGPKPTEVLVTDFLAQCATRPERRTAAEWLELGSLAPAGPAEFIARIEDSLDDPAHQELASSIATGLAFCIAEAPEQPEAFERADRLPLARARREAKAWSNASTTDFVRHVLESWVSHSMSFGAGAAGWQMPEREERPFSGYAWLWRMADGNSLQHLRVSRPRCPRQTGLELRSTLQKNASFFLLEPGTRKAASDCPEELSGTLKGG